MFNSTLTKDEAFLCPVDGSIMITGTLGSCSHLTSFVFPNISFYENALFTETVIVSCGEYIQLGSYTTIRN
jgi:hypothetical protein